MTVYLKTAYFVDDAITEKNRYNIVFLPDGTFFVTQEKDSINRILKMDTLSTAILKSVFGALGIGTIILLFTGGANLGVISALILITGFLFFKFSTRDSKIKFVPMKNLYHEKVLEHLEDNDEEAFSGILENTGIFYTKEMERRNLENFFNNSFLEEAFDYFNSEDFKNNDDEVQEQMRKSFSEKMYSIEAKISRLEKEIDESSKRVKDLSKNYLDNLGLS